MKTAIVCGAGGFIGGHLVKRLKQDDFWVRGVDQKHPEFAPDELVIAHFARCRQLPLYIPTASRDVRLMRPQVEEPLNIGSEELITISGLADLIIEISGKRLAKAYVPGPTGVRGRSSDNRRIRELLGWAPIERLRDGLTQTYARIATQSRP